MAKKLGRPPKPAEDQLSEVVPLRLKPGEREQLQAAASSEGVNLSAWMRDKLLRAARRVAKRA